MFLINSHYVRYLKNRSKVRKGLSVSAVSEATYQAIVAELVALGLGGFNLSEWFQEKFDELNVELRDAIEKHKAELEQQRNAIEGDFTEESSEEGSND